MHESLRKQLKNNTERVNIDGNFYISSALNEVILNSGKVMMSMIDRSEYHSFYEPTRISAFELTPLASTLRASNHGHSSVNVVIPAAGEGSRFAEAGWKKPKPFIDIGGEPMLSHVIKNVTPVGAKVTLLLRKKHILANQNIIKQFENVGVEIESVDNLTEGTACTVLLARQIFDNDQPMMVVNSDQLVNFDVSDFVQTA